MSEVNQFKARLEAERGKKKAEAEARAADAKAKAAAKDAAKKKALRAVEDDWLFGEPKDNKPGPPDDDEDDDRGFQMMDLVSAPVQQAAPKTSKALKVVNLINFDECDQAQDEEIFAAHQASASEPYDERRSGPVTAQLPLQPSSPRLLQASADCAAQLPEHAAMADEGLGPESDSVLLQEISLLRQQLQDAQELGNIQIEIIRDEVAEKQRTVEELQQQRTDIQASLKGAEQRIGELESQVHVAKAAAAAAETASSQSESASAAVVSVQLTAGATALLSEALTLSARAQRSLTGSECKEQFSEAGDVEANIRALRDSVSALHQVAEAAAEERIQFAARLQDAERLPSPQPVQQMVPLRGAVPTDTIGVGTDDGTLEAEAQAHAEVLGRHAAQALREVRLNAERQLALIRKRMDVSQRTSAT